MKKIFFAVCIGLLSTAAFAQAKEGKEEKKEVQPVVPAAVTQAFAKDYPGVKASWEAEDGFFEAEFKAKGAEASATYNASGHRVSSEMEIKTTELPAGALDYVKKNYPTHKLNEAAKITDDKNVVMYEAEVEKDGKSMDLIFDAAGKFLKEAEGD